MPDELTTRILSSKTDMSQEEIARLTTGQAWAIIRSLRQEKVKDSRLQVCFTGFGRTRKNELKAMAQPKFRVASSVTKTLDYLCAGGTPGPKKVETATQQGVQIITEQQFINLLETGELPNET